MKFKGRLCDLHEIPKQTRKINMSYDTWCDLLSETWLCCSPDVNQLHLELKDKRYGKAKIIITQ